MNHNKINKALEVLRVEGLKHFDEGVKIGKYQAIGAAIAQVDDSIFTDGTSKRYSVTVVIQEI